MFHKCSIYVPFMSHLCSMHVPFMFHVYSIYVPCMFFLFVLYVGFVCRLYTVCNWLLDCSRSWERAYNNDVARAAKTLSESKPKKKTTKKQRS